MYRLAGAFGAVSLAGCTLLVSVDGLTGGPLESSLDGGDAARGGDAGERDSSKPIEPTPEAGVVSRYRAAVLADTPSVYLRFGEAPGASTVRTEVGTTTATYDDGMNLGAPGALVGDPDTAIEFSKGIIVLPPGVECAGTSECAIEMWIRIEAYQDGYHWAVDHQLWDGNRRGWNFEISTGAMQYERWLGDGTSSSVSTMAKLSLRGWHHLVGVSDHAGQRMYVDGAVRENHNGKAIIPSTGAKWTIGANNCFTCGDRNWFEGTLDELAIYEHTLSEDRINAHVAAAR